MVEVCCMSLIVLTRSSPNRKAVTGTAGEARAAYSLFSVCANITRLRNETSCEPWPMRARASVALDTMAGISTVV